MNKPLENIRVVELSTFVAAPSCARLLADMGAEVIKIEHPKGDAWRHTALSYKPGFYNYKHNPVFDIYNSNKKHIAINLKSEEGMEAMHKLLEKTDIFITNTRPAALERLGLSYEQLKQRYPSLIYAIILGYGEKGPDASLPAFDTTAFGPGVVSCVTWRMRLIICLCMHLPVWVIHSLDTYCWHRSLQRCIAG